MSPLVGVMRKVLERELEGFILLFFLVNVVMVLRRFLDPRLFGVEDSSSKPRIPLLGCKAACDVF